MKKLIPLFVTAIIGTIAAYGMWELTSNTHPQTDLGEVTIGGDFSLTDQNGKTVTNQDFKGKLMLVYFGFTYCPDICPTDLSIMAQAMQKLGSDASKVAPIFITVDPERDTVAQLKSYLSNFKAPIVGLTGDTKPAIKEYKVYAQKVQRTDLNDYTMDHSAFMYLMGRDGKYITHFAHDSAPDTIAATIKEHL